MDSSALNRVRSIVLTIAVALLATSCGAGGGGVNDGATGPALVTFMQTGVDTVQLNQDLEFRFSEPVDPGTVGPGSIQIREGPAYGATVPGEFRTEGEQVLFTPDLPSHCDYTDSGLKPGTTYRVTLAATPSSVAVRDLSGKPLIDTSVHEFSTRPESDPDLFADQIPGQAPYVQASSPEDRTPAALLSETPTIVVTFSENLDPCSLILGNSIRIAAYERGDPGLFLDGPGTGKSGFDPVVDQADDDPYTWGANGTPLVPEVLIPASVALTQTRDVTQVTVTPLAGAFPENALIVLDLTNEIRDLGGSPLAPRSISFTVENLNGSDLALEIPYDGTTPINGAATTVDVDTPRSPNLAQAWLSFSGDGDNGPDPVTLPSWPVLDAGGNFVTCDFRENDGVLDDLIVDGIVELNTGETPIEPSCLNGSDGSTAVVWELNNLTVTANGILRFRGVNPAILLVRNEVQVMTGGQIQIDGADGENSHDWNAVNSNARDGGNARAGGGDGGDTLSAQQAMSGTVQSDDGVAGYGSPDYETEGGQGAGQGGSTSSTSSSPCNYTKGAQGGGGGAHAEAGSDAGLVQPTGSTWRSATTGHGGAVYATDDSMQLPSAGSGGGGGGSEASTAGSDESSGGGGGAGGGFLGIAAGGDIRIYGLIDAGGGHGGRGGWDPDGNCNGANSGGGGGGAGGGIRLISAGAIDVTGATLTAAGGIAGASGGSRGGTTGQNSPLAGDGASGRIVLEDFDGLITGLGTGNITPGEGQPGFYRAPFDSLRFVTGGTEGTATTLPLPLGTILEPGTVLFEPVLETDLALGIPAGASPGPDAAAFVIEVRGYDGFADGTVDETSATGWFVVGYARDSGIENAPVWRSEQAPPGFEVDPAGGVGIAGVNQKVFIEVRTWFRMADDTAATQPGPYVDWMRLRYSFDN